MRFFTREWHSGVQSDDEAEQAVREYRRQLASILPDLSPALREFGRDSNLHDALIRRVEVGLGATKVRIQLRAGDLASGYFDVGLSYSDVRIDLLDRPVLAVIARDPGTELLYDELDVVDKDVFVHRLLFWPYYREVHIVFSGFSADRVPRPSRAVETVPDRYLEQ
jgi:hypothetical protein